MLVKYLFCDQCGARERGCGHKNWNSRIVVCEDCGCFKLRGVCHTCIDKYLRQWSANGGT